MEVQLKASFKKYLDAHPTAKVEIVGHSLGGAFSVPTGMRRGHILVVGVSLFAPGSYPLLVSLCSRHGVSLSLKGNNPWKNPVGILTCDTYPL